MICGRLPSRRDATSSAEQQSGFCTQTSCEPATAIGPIEVGVFGGVGIKTKDGSAELPSRPGLLQDDEASSR
jgi:hypothetical protein